MEFIGSILSLFIVVGGLVIARDWLSGLRLDAAATRGEVAEMKALVATLRDHAAVSFRADAAAHEMLKEIHAEVSRLRSQWLEMTTKHKRRDDDDDDVSNWPETQR